MGQFLKFVFVGLVAFADAVFIFTILRRIYSVGTIQTARAEPTDVSAAVTTLLLLLLANLTVAVMALVREWEDLV